MGLKCKQIIRLKPWQISWDLAVGRHSTKRLAFDVYFAVAEIDAQLAGHRLAELGDGFEFCEDEAVFEAPAHLRGGKDVEAGEDFIVHHAAGFVDRHIHHHLAATCADGGRVFYPSLSGQDCWD